MVNKYENVVDFNSHQEMQIKTTMGYHYTPIRMAKMKKTENTKCYEDTEQSETLIAASGNVR